MVPQKIGNCSASSVYGAIKLYLIIQMRKQFGPEGVAFAKEGYKRFRQEEAAKKLKSVLLHSDQLSDYDREGYKYTMLGKVIPKYKGKVYFQEQMMPLGLQLVKKGEESFNSSGLCLGATYFNQMNPRLAA